MLSGSTSLFFGFLCKALVRVLESRQKRTTDAVDYSLTQDEDKI
jgi:hypothetical protein